MYTALSLERKPSNTLVSITPRTCPRGEVISCVVVVIVHTEIAISRDLDVVASVKCCQNVDKIDHGCTQYWNTL